MSVHNFKDQLRWSQTGSDEPFWDAVYRKAFPNFLNSMTTGGDNDAQRKGIDRVVVLKNGKLLRIDEKKRRKNRGDILLEYCSVDTTGAPGWIEKDQACSHIAYAFMDVRRVYLLPFSMLRKAWLLNRQAWWYQAEEERDGFRLCSAPNDGYKTWSMAVPIPVLLEAIRDAAVRSAPVIIVDV